MQRATAYAVLAAELEAWRKLPQAELLSLLVQPPKSRVVTAGGEEIVLEVVVSWATEKRKAFKIAGTAYGPSHQLTERLEESLIVPRSA
jgi:hypothetical protein